MSKKLSTREERKLKTVGTDREFGLAIAGFNRAEESVILRDL